VVASQSRLDVSTCNLSWRPPAEARSVTTSPCKTVRSRAIMVMSSHRSCTRSSWWLENSTVQPLRVRSRRHRGGAEGTRTPDPLHAMEVRYQLRHSPGCRTAPQG
jgi:hypothetical protein